jgi:hypothetical protein
VAADSIDVMALHLAIIGIAVLLGFLARLGLIGIENVVPAIAQYGMLVVRTHIIKTL